MQRSEEVAIFYLLLCISSLMWNPIMKAPLFNHAIRGVALFLGGFTLLNFVGEWFVHGFDATIWWLDLHAIPSSLERIFLALFGVLTLCFGLNLRIANSLLFRRITGVVTFATAVGAIVNTVVFFHLSAESRFAPGTPLPFSLFVSIGLIVISISAFINPSYQSSSQSPQLGTMAFAAVAALLFPLALIFFFGSSDYRRPADVAVVFGAKTFASGAISIPLADRVERACELYREGVVRRLLFSGGPGEGAIDETEGMKNFALRQGVKEQDIILDHDGIGTEETVRNSITILDSLGAHRVVAISQAYHLPRIKMTYMRYGRNVYTIPADDRSRHGRGPKQLGREIVAFWAYYLRPLCNV